MKRRLFAILSALSLILFVAVCVLWVRSYWRADTLSFRHREGKPTRWVYVTSASGRVGIGSYWTAYPWHPGPEWAQGGFGWRSAPVNAARSGDDPQYVIWERMGVRLLRSRGSRQVLSHVSMPSYLCTVICAAPPVAVCYGSAVVRRRRVVAGSCPSCGYDLRATPGRCPECGAGATSTGRGEEADADGGADGCG